MVKVFTTNENGKIEFTKEELEKLLNEVWYDGKNNGNYCWKSPGWTSPTITYNGTGVSTLIEDYVTRANNKDGVTITTISEEEPK